MTENLLPTDFTTDGWVNAWEGTILEAVETVGDDFTYTVGVSGKHVTFELSDLAKRYDEITSVSIIAMCGRNEVANQKLTAALLIDDVSQGVVEVVPSGVSPSFEYETFELSAWNGPWSVRQMNSAKVKFSSIIGATGAVGVDYFYVTVVGAALGLRKKALALGMI